MLLLTLQVDPCLDALLCPSPSILPDPAQQGVVAVTLYQTQTQTHDLPHNLEIRLYFSIQSIQPQYS